MKRLAAAFLGCVLVLTVLPGAQQKSPGAGPIIVLETVKGTIEFETYPEEAPKTVERIVELVKKGFYDGLTFHRIEPGFVIQGGDPKGDGTGGPGYKIKAEFNKNQHVRGAVAMARSNDPDSAGSQFYIVLAPAHFLDGKYTVFGKVLKGMDVVNKIQKGDVLKRAYLKDEAAKS